MSAEGAVMRMARTPGRRTVSPAGTAAVTPGRWHGSLDTITDSERRALRPIGTTAQEVAARTGFLLGILPAGPGVRIFQGVHPAPAEEDLPRIPHAISAGRQLLLVESVAWPPGRYHQEADGRIHCDGTYIGQSARPLINAVRYWRAALPRGHRVSALVVVHPTGDGDLALPAAVTGELAWARAGDAIRALRARLPRGRPAASAGVIAALVTATARADTSGQAGGRGTMDS
jgi:hypothetical protein